MKASRVLSNVVRYLVVAAIFAIVFCLMSTQRDNFGAPPVSGMPPPSLSAQDENQIAQIHLAGLHGEHSQVPTIIASLKNSPYPGYNTGYTQIALNALSRLAATESLPEIEAIIQDEKHPYLINGAKIAKARILAESSVKGVTPGASQAAKKINRFYAELGLNSAGINAAVADYKTRSSQPNGESRSLPPTPIEVLAMQAIADMVYHGSYADYTSLPDIVQLNFQLDYGSALKMRLAPLSQAARLTTLVGELSTLKYFAPTDNLKMQLVIDEGVKGSLVVAAKLQQMDSNQSLYSAEGFSALFRILGAMGDKSQSLLLTHFNDEDKLDYSQKRSRKTYGAYEVLNSVAFVKGYKRQVVSGY